LDLNAVEDNHGEADMPVAMIARTNTITMLQMDGRFKKDEFECGLKLARNACHKIYELQRTALMEKYGKSVGEGEE